MIVELIYEKTCPNIEGAREQLLKAFTETGIPSKWTEWEVSDPDAPEHIHGYGSPTILVNKQDVNGLESRPGKDYSCRVYSHNEAAGKGVPAVKDISRSLAGAGSGKNGSKSSFISRIGLGSTSLPALGVAFLPKLTCPACWPAYAGLLSTFGISFVDYTPYMLPLTGFFLLIALAALAYRAPSRRGYQPFVAGVLASALILIGKFQFESDWAMYFGLFMLGGASIWNTWSKADLNNAACPNCLNEKTI